MRQKPNLLDRFIATVAPGMAVKREVARRRLNILNSGYSHHGASRSKKSLLGWVFSGGSPDDDITENLDTLRQRSRDLYMGAPLATGALKTMRTNVVGAGLKLKAQIDADFLGLSEEAADAWERNVEREFALWANSKDADAARMKDFNQLQQLAFLSWLMSGDVLALLPIVPRKGCVYDLRVNLIEADRLCNPQVKPAGKDIEGGVEVGPYGEPITYYIADKHPLSSKSGIIQHMQVKAFGERTGRRNVLHLMEAERPGQRRGVPYLAPVIEALKQLSRYTEAELMAAVVSGMFTVFITSDTPDAPIGEVVPENQQIGQSDEVSYELGNGAIIGLAPGEQVKETNPGRPNVAFDGFVTAICRQIGVALEIPYEVLVKHFTASYSAARAALLEAWKSFRMRRAWLASDFCQPIYEEWLTEAVAKGRVYAPGFFDDPAIRAAYCGARWYGPSPGQIDPLKEVNAAEKRVDNGFSTRAQETAELSGGDWEQNHRQRVKEERLRREGGVISAKEQPQQVLANPEPD